MENDAESVQLLGRLRESMAKHGSVQKCLELLKGTQAFASINRSTIFRWFKKGAFNQANRLRIEAVIGYLETAPIMDLSLKRRLRILLEVQQKLLLLNPSSEDILPMLKAIASSNLERFTLEQLAFLLQVQPAVSIRVISPVLVKEVLDARRS